MADSEQAHQPVLEIVEAKPVDDLDTPWGEAPHISAAEAVDAEIARAMDAFIEPELAEGDELPPVDVRYENAEYPVVQMQLFDEAFDEIDDLTYRVEDLETETDSVVVRLDSIEEAIEDGKFAERLDVEKEIDWLYDDIDRRFDVYQADYQEDIKEQLSGLRRAFGMMAEADTAYLEGRISTVHDHVIDAADKLREVESRLEELEKTLDLATGNLVDAIAHRDGLLMRGFDIMRSLASRVDQLEGSLGEALIGQEDLHATQRRQTEVISGFVQSAAEVMSDQVVRIEDIQHQIEGKLENHGAGLNRAFRQINQQREHLQEHTTKLMQHETRLTKAEDLVDQVDYDLRCCMA